MDEKEGRYGTRVTEDRRNIATVVLTQVEGVKVLHSQQKGPRYDAHNWFRWDPWVS